VLGALGLSPAQAKGSIRLGWGRYTTMDELEQGIGMILEAAEAQA
jgi:cysteine desulfurase